MRRPAELAVGDLAGDEARLNGLLFSLRISWYAGLAVSSTGHHTAATMADGGTRAR